MFCLKIDIYEYIFSRVKRKKRRRHGYITGVHNSSKSSNPIKFRSGWEQKYCLHLDADASVASYEYEPFAIPYVSNKRTGKLRRYFPDFLVFYDDGHTELVEIKPKKRLHQPRVHKKVSAASDWAKANNVTLKILTEIELSALGVLNIITEEAC